MVARIKHIIIIAFSLFTFAANGQSLLNKNVSLQCDNISLAQALDQLSEQYQLSFSYNPDLFDVERKVTLNIENKLETVLDSLFIENIKCIETGNYVIIQPNKIKPIPKRKTKEAPLMTITGVVVDMRTGEAISNVSIYQMGENYSTISTSTGGFFLSVPQTNNTLNIKYSKKNYLDTIIIVEPADTTMQIKLRPNDKLEQLPIKEIKQIEAEYDNAVEQMALTRLIVPDDQLAYSNNFTEMETRPIQFSVLPIIGTNGLMSGAIKNKVSFNLLGGYNGGVEGVEFGALVNIIKEDVNGWQFAGLTNLVGDDVTGVQFAGFSNNVMGKVKGAQLAGFSNVVFDTLKGTQFAGFNNLVLSEVQGIQYSGFDNIALKNAGEQYAGFLNVSVKEVVVQAAGFANFAGTLTGGQLSGFINVAGDSSRGVQFAGFANIASEFKGMQTAGFINIAGNMKGVQLGVINISDSLKGIPIGLFSYSRKGYHTWELSGEDFIHANIKYRTGTNGLHNIYTAGVRFDGTKQWYSFGLGLGSRVVFGKKKWSVNAGATTSFVSDLRELAALSFLNSGSLDLEYRPLKHLALFAGATYNLLIVDHFLPSEYHVAQNFMIDPISVTSTQYTNNYQWVGFKVGVRF